MLTSHFVVDGFVAAQVGPSDRGGKTARYICQGRLARNVSRTFRSIMQQNIGTG